MILGQVSVAPATIEQSREDDVGLRRRNRPPDDTVTPGFRTLRPLPLGPNLMFIAKEATGIFGCSPSKNVRPASS